jgi:hypothetical protein
MIEGMWGEQLTFPVRSVDLAFLLGETLKAHAWSKEHVQQSVLGFLDMPMMSVEWQGKDEETGLLKCV